MQNPNHSGELGVNNSCKPELPHTIDNTTLIGMERIQKNLLERLLLVDFDCNSRSNTLKGDTENSSRSKSTANRQALRRVLGIKPCSGN